MTISLGWRILEGAGIVGPFPFMLIIRSSLTRFLGQFSLISRLSKGRCGSWALTIRKKGLSSFYLREKFGRTIYHTVLHCAHWPFRNSRRYSNAFFREGTTFIRHTHETILELLLVSGNVTRPVFLVKPSAPQFTANDRSIEDHPSGHANLQSIRGQSKRRPSPASLSMLPESSIGLYSNHSARQSRGSCVSNE